MKKKKAKETVQYVIPSCKEFTVGARRVVCASQEGYSEEEQDWE